MTAPQGHRDARPQALPWWFSHHRLEQSLSGMAFISMERSRCSLENYSFLQATRRLVFSQASPCSAWDFRCGDKCPVPMCTQPRRGQAIDQVDAWSLGVDRRQVGAAVAMDRPCSAMATRLSDVPEVGKWWSIAAARIRISWECHAYKLTLRQAIIRCDWRHRLTDDTTSSRA